MTSTGFRGWRRGRHGRGADGLPGAELKSGIEIVTQALNLEEHIHDCTWVLTGEGRIDSQSINGKVPVGVASVAKNTISQ